MRVLVATTETQGRDLEDVCSALDGELVAFPADECGDPTCTCGLFMIGLGTDKVTTTFEVRDLPHLDEDTYAELLGAYLFRHGAFDGDDDEAVRAFVSHVTRLARLARTFTPGTVLSRDGEDLTLRRLAAA